MLPFLQATKNTGPLLEALAPRISDTDAVRKALLQLLSGQVRNEGKDVNLFCTQFQGCPHTQLQSIGGFQYIGGRL